MPAVVRGIKDAGGNAAMRRARDHLDSEKK